jgi:large subunit ribosomal protein L24
MLKLKVGDKVKVLAGKDKGREGEIERLFIKEGLVVIPGINMYKKHFKGVQGQKSGIYDIPRPLAISKVMLICPKCKKATRVGFRLDEKEKVRICKKCQKQIDAK